MLDFVYLYKSNYFYLTHKRTFFRFYMKKITNITDQIINKTTSITKYLIEKLQFDCGTPVLG